jgi:putative copper export protein/methionine-rich copper-binding protein CopC
LSRRTRRSVVAAFLLLALFPLEAAAHQRLLRTEPARDEAVAAVPRELRLSFAEPVQVVFTRIELIGPDGQPIALGESRVAADSTTVLVVPIAGMLHAGRYTVRWATASQDGHPVSGEYGFAIAADAAGLHVPEPAEPACGEYGAGVTAPGQQQPPAEHHPVAVAADAFRADSPGYVAVRWLNFLALLGVIGAVAFAIVVIGHMRRRQVAADDALIAAARARAAGVGLACAALLAVAAVGRLYAQSLAMHGADHALDAGRITMLLGRTVWGWGWMLQVTATLLAAVGFVAARRGAAGGWATAACAALVLAVTPAMSGHAAAMTGAVGTLAIVNDTVHVLAAGGWLGSLLVLLLAGIPAAIGTGPERRGAAAASLVRAFSPTALMFAGLLILTGVVATFIHSSSLAALIDSRYGTLLFIKLGIFLLVFGTGAYNYLRVQPALGDDVGTGRLRRTAGFELAVGAAVLLVTAVLVATARPYEEDDDMAAGAEPAAGVVLHTQPL